MVLEVLQVSSETDILTVKTEDNPTIMFSKLTFQILPVTFKA